MFGCLASLGVAGAHYAFWRVHERRFLMLMINWLLINNYVQATQVDMSLRRRQLAAGMRVRNAGSCSWHAFFATLQLAAGMQFRFPLLLAMFVLMEAGDD